MEHEISFPNPLERTDLPTKRRRWPKVVAAILVVCALLTAFLPQILRTGPGKSLVFWQIERQTHMKVWFQDIRTSWFGGTTITNVAMKDVYGKRFGARQIKCEASLWKLIRGQYELGATTADEVMFDYVVDYGDGKDLFARMSGAPPANAPGAAPGSADPGASLPLVAKRMAISGQITLTNSWISVTRGVVLQKARGFTNDFYSIKTAGVNGTIDIPASGADWTVDLAGIFWAEKSEDAGAFTLAGKANAGKSGSFAQRDATANLKLSARKVPTENLGWIINPQLSRDDYRQMMGPSLDTIDVAINLDDGKLRFDTLKLAGRDATNTPTLIEGKPVFDVAARTPVMTVGDGAIHVVARVTPGVGVNYLSYINPFLYTAVDGWMDVTIERASVPLGKTKDKATLQGEEKLSAVVLLPDTEWGQGQLPASLVGQWQHLTGAAQLRPVLESQPVKFTSDGKTIKSGLQTLTLSGNKVVLVGTTGENGALQLSASISLPDEFSTQIPELSGVIVAAIGGTLDKPYMDAASTLQPVMRERVRTLMSKHINDQLTRDMERIKDQRGRPIIDDLTHMQTLIGVPPPTTSPATQP